MMIDQPNEFGTGPDASSVGQSDELLKNRFVVFGWCWIRV